jgi:hypothetical protein
MPDARDQTSDFALRDLKIISEFVHLVSESFKLAGLPEDEALVSTRRAISQIEQTAETVETFIEFLETLKSRYVKAFSEVVGRPVARLLIAPIPPYLEPALPWIVSDFPEVVLADNHRAGEVIAGRTCRSMADALAAPEGFDAYFLGTITSRFASFFRDQFPPLQTIGVWELRQNELAVPALAMRQGHATEVLEAIDLAGAPVLVLTTFIDVTLLSTYQALAEKGFNVIFLTRHSHSTDSPVNKASSQSFSGFHLFQLNFAEMVEVLKTNKRAPVIINYQRLFSINRDMRDCLYLMAYSVALVKLTSANTIIHLYDLYNLCLSGFSMEAPLFRLYEAMLLAADAILCNSDPLDVFEKYLPSGKPVISLLRYPPRSQATAKAEEGPFTIVMITGFLGEHDDPTRMTERAVRSLLGQGAHVHYYSNNARAKEFKQLADGEFPGQFHLHDPIADQSELVQEISRYDVGWLVIDMRPFTGLEVHFSSPFAKDLGRIFHLVSFATAGLLYGAAGLPIFLQKESYVSRLCTAGAAFALELTEDGDLVGGRAPIDQVDWARARALAFEARETFFMDQHIAKLSSHLKDLSRSNLTLSDGTA